MDITHYSPESGRYVDESGNVRNFVNDLLTLGNTAQPVGGKKINILQLSPRSGRFIAEDGSIYNLKDLLEGIGRTQSYSKEEIDNKISALVQEIDWKEAVDTFADLSTTYPDAEDGWTASTLDTDKIYRFDGENWVDIYTLPQIATASNDGLMSAQQVRKLSAAETADAAQDALLIGNAARNLLKITAESQTINGVTFTVNKNGAGEVVSVTVNGTATATAVFNGNMEQKLPDGDYILNGCNNGSQNNTYWHRYYYTSTTAVNAPNGDAAFRYDAANNPTGRYQILVASGYTADNITIYPMIRRAGITDDTFEPYYRTQKQLDADLTALTNYVNTITDFDAEVF